MHSVAETSIFTRRADALLTQVERDELISTLAADPQAGDVIPGMGGIRKMRFAAGGQGKRGGFRVVWFLPRRGRTSAGAADLRQGRAGQPKPRAAPGYAGDRRPAAPRQAMTNGGEHVGKTDITDELIASMQEGAAILRGEADPSRFHPAPPPLDVRAIRRKTTLTQAAFAARFGFSPGTVRDWEQGRSRPDQAARSYLLVIEREPEAVERALHSEQSAM